MRRRTFARSSGLDRYVPFGLFGGQVSGAILLILSLVLIIVSAARPALFEPMRIVARLTFAPALETFSKPFITLSETLDYLYSLTQLKTEVEKLRADNKKLEEWFSVAQMLQAENQSLRDLLKVKLDPGLTFVSARVIGDMGGAYAQSVMVGVGSSDGVSKGDAVLGGEGLVGRIISAEEHAAVVLLATDLNSRVPVRVEGSNVQGIMAGTNGQRLWLDRTPEGSSIGVGNRVLTSGIGGVFPPDLPVGRVQTDKSGRAYIAPYADFSRLLFVRIVSRPGSPVPVKSPSVPVQGKGVKND